MNDLISSIILAIVQGITEWLPISSSGHLVLFQKLLGIQANVPFDVALHFGTLMAVFVYFGKDITDILESLLKGKWKSEKAKLGLLIFVASIPAGIIGILFKSLIESAFSSLILVAIGFGITSVSLFIASIKINNSKSQASYIDSIIIGSAQALAILPGISRSGSTISAGVLRNLDTKSAMRFSFLMSIPAIFGAGIIEIGNNDLTPNMFWATMVSFVIGLATIHFLLKFVSHSNKNLMWFGIYAGILAISILLFYLFGSL